MEEVKQKNWFHSSEFAEALGIAWGFSSFWSTTFAIRCDNKEVIKRFHELVEGSNQISSRIEYIQENKDKPYVQWYCTLYSSHPFVLKLIDMGWVPISKEDRPYPSGSFNEGVFIKTYLNLHHTLGTLYEKKKDYVRARLRIHGTFGVLDEISNYLLKDLGIQKKKIQNCSNTNRTKILYFYSKNDIFLILNFIENQESIKKYQSLKLGYGKRIKESNPLFS